MTKHPKNQGRSPEKQEEIYQIIKFAFIIFLAVMLGGLLTGIFAISFLYI